MKVSNINARIDRSGKHNDRNFNLDNAPHIAQERIKENIYWTYNGDEEHTFDEIEKEFYEKHFSEHLEAQRQRNKAIGHPERNQSVEEYHHAKFSRPEDKILQIGNQKEHATKEELWACALEYQERFDAVFGNHCKIVDMALHMDEATPHVHVRRVWISQDKDGNDCVGQGKALRDLGIMDPDTTKPNSKYNNAKVTFTKSDIELFKNICIEKGLDIDKTRPPANQKHMSTLEYKKKQMEQDVDELERTQSTLRQAIEETKKELNEIDDVIVALTEQFEDFQFSNIENEEELESLKTKNRKDQLNSLLSIYKQEIEPIIKSEDDFHTAVIKAQISSELRKVEQFLEKKGLLEEYKNDSGRKNVDVQKVQNSYF